MTFEEWFGANMHKIPGDCKLYRPLFEDAYRTGKDAGYSEASGTIEELEMMLNEISSWDSFEVE